MEYTTQNLEYAVSVFYQDEQTERAKAHSWLTTAQRVPEAWTFVWELLQPNKRTEVQFYAATTLHTKILRCWNELPPESHEELKEKIIQAVIGYSKGPKIVTNRLCISLAAFILQHGTTDLAAILRPLSSIDNMPLLLEVLTVIPEEYNSMTMGSVLRARNRRTLQQACPAVLDDMLRHLQTVYNVSEAEAGFYIVVSSKKVPTIGFPWCGVEPYTVYIDSDHGVDGPSENTIQSWQTAATCAVSWLNLGGEDSPDCNTTLSDRLPLCRALMSVVHLLYSRSVGSAVCGSGLDASEACLAALRAAGCAGDASRCTAAAALLIADLAALADPLITADNVPDSINEELLSSLITCLVALGECHAATLVGSAARAGDEGAGARRLVQLLLEAQAAPGHYPLHETRSNLVFGFWYTLQDEVLNVLDGSQATSPIWREVFSRLLVALIRKAEMPPDAALAKDELELLRCYRQDIADTVMYCFGVVGEECWALVERALDAGECGREAALHAACALADAAPHARAPPALLRVLHHALHLAATSADVHTLTTALDCLGSYAIWVGSLEGESSGGLGGLCVRAAGGALPRAPGPAARALRRLCTDCSGSAALLAEDIVQAAQSCAGRSERWVRRQLLGAAGAALAAAEPSVAAPLLQHLARSLAAELTQQTGATEAMCSAAEGAAALVGALAERPALRAALLSTLLPALPLYAQHPTLLEPMFQILKQAIVAMVDDCLPLMNDIGLLITAGFATQPCALGLDVVKLMVLVCDSWSGCAEAARACLARSARALAAPAPAAPAHAEPDLAEALFATLHAITKKKPRALDWIDDMMPQLVELACGCVRWWEGGGSRAACAWLSALAAARPAPALLQAAPTLTTHALRCIGGATPRSQVEPLAELMLALNRAQWRTGGEGDGEEGLGAWLRQALAPPGFPTVHATDTHKHKFIAAVIKEKNSKRRLLETVQEFSLVCRGLIGTEYARQTLSSKKLVS